MVTSKTKGECYPMGKFITHPDVVLVRPGFHMELDNGWTISVQWGDVNYCSNRFNQEHDGTSETAEIHVFATENPSITYNFGNDDVLGWQTTDSVCKWMDHVRQLPPPNTI